jgi:hypothetical protein
MELVTATMETSYMTFTGLTDRTFKVLSDLETHLTKVEENTMVV